MKKGRAALFAASFLVAAGPAGAQTGWGRIGRTQAAPAGGQATITVSSADAVRELMFCVEDADFRFSGIIVRYSDGTSQPIGLRDRIAAGRCGREISLRSRRAVAGIDISYDPAVLAGGTAKVQAYGR